MVNLLKVHSFEKYIKKVTFKFRQTNDVINHEAKSEVVDVYGAVILVDSGLITLMNKADYEETLESDPEVDCAFVIFDVENKELNITNEMFLDKLKQFSDFEVRLFYKEKLSKYFISKYDNNNDSMDIYFK